MEEIQGEVLPVQEPSRADTGKTAATHSHGDIPTVMNEGSGGPSFCEGSWGATLLPKTLWGV